MIQQRPSWTESNPLSSIDHHAVMSEYMSEYGADLNKKVWKDESPSFDFNEPSIRHSIASYTDTALEFTTATANLKQEAQLSSLATARRNSSTISSTIAEDINSNDLNYRFESMNMTAFSDRDTNKTYGQMKQERRPSNPNSGHSQYGQQYNMAGNMHGDRNRHAQVQQMQQQQLQLSQQQQLQAMLALGQAQYVMIPGVGLTLVPVMQSPLAVPQMSMALPPMPQVDQPFHTLL